jgi:hypothetical protein
VRPPAADLVELAVRMSQFTPSHTTMLSSRRLLMMHDHVSQATHAKEPRDVSASAIAASGRAAKAATDSLAAAVTAANTPLWLLGLRCLGSAAAATCAAMAISRVLHQAADRSDAGEVPVACTRKGCTWSVANRLFNKGPAQTRALRRPVLRHTSYVDGTAFSVLFADCRT